MEHMVSLLAQYGLLLVFANVLLTQAGLPLPALPMLIVAGALVHDGQLSLAPVLLAAVAGSLAGDLPWYAAGRMAGYRVLRVLCRISFWTHARPLHAKWTRVIFPALLQWT